MPILRDSADTSVCMSEKDPRQRAGNMTGEIERVNPEQECGHRLRVISQFVPSLGHTRIGDTIDSAYNLP